MNFPSSIPMSIPLFSVFTACLLVYAQGADWRNGNHVTNQAASGLAHTTTLFANGDRAALEALAQLAAERFGKGMFTLGSSGMLGIDLGALQGAGLGSVTASDEHRSLSVNVSSLFGSISDAYGAAVLQGTPDAMRASTSFFVNELALPSAQLVERAQQFGQIATAIESASEACGVYAFSAGGAAVNAKWTGPTFTLTQTSGNCVIQPAFQGEGNTRWTRLQETLACLGPSTQWSWEPLKYSGVSHKRTMLEAPECKLEYKYGPEVSVTLYGGDSKGKIKFETEKEFYAAMLINKTFDFNIKEFKALANTIQLRVDNTVAELGSLIGTAVATEIPTYMGIMGKYDSPSILSTGGPESPGTWPKKGVGSRSLFSQSSL